jgi:glycosyltransferase involved in cell wall biosynthesis
MRFHLIGLPHVQTTRAYNWCAFSMKVINFSEMMTSLGHEVFLYSGEQNEAKCTEHIPVVTDEQQHKWFGHYDWSTDVFNGWQAGSEWWETMNQTAIAEISKRIEPKDFVCVIAGRCQESIVNAFPAHIAVEWGIGYPGIFAKHRVFESYAWMHHLQGVYRNEDVRFFDTVIPNSFRISDFPLGRGDGGYYLFIGRFIRRKGIEIAVEATKRIDARLVMAGQGMKRKGDLYCGEDITVCGYHLKHVGVVGIEERAKLMGAAKAVFVPTTYLEPFGGVAVEANLCGTPVITTDHGAFTETVTNGFNGWRCRTLSDFMRAAQSVYGMDRAAIRNAAQDRYSTDNIRHQYEKYFERLLTLWGHGWYQDP